MLTRLLALLLCLSWTLLAGEGLKPVADGPEGKKAFDDLAAYYKDNSAKPPYAKALADLKSATEATRTSAGKYLAALLKQLYADETNGRAPHHKSPFFGGGGATNDGREFRKVVAKDFGDSAEGDAAFDGILWLLNEEKDAKNQAEGIKALQRSQSPRVAEILKALLTQPNPNAEIAKAAIEETGKRNLKALAPEITKLYNSYRKSLREAAVKVAPALGIANLPDVKAEDAITPGLDQQLKNAAAMVLTEIPKDAKWTRFTVENKGAPAGRGGGGGNGEFSGWLLGEEKGQLHIVDLFGQERFLDKSKTKTADRNMADDAAWLASLRKGGGRDVTEVLSREGIATGQFEPKFVSVPEVLFAAWANQRGDKTSAAQVLFPRIEDTADDRWVFWVARDLLGAPYHQAMLDAFTRDRDYPKAIAIAKHLSKPVFEEYNYQERAKKLAAQLEKRSDDFKTFTLPTVADWETKKKTLKRDQQVTFLAEHLRLLNCVQMGQPGGINYEDAQKPAGVINPYVELKKMDLQVGELPPLVPFIGDENFMLCYSYWRDFHPKRDLHQVNWIAIEIINAVAHRDLAESGVFSELDEVGKKQHIDKIVAWCKANASKSTQELALDTLQTSKDWRAIQAACGEAVHSHYVKAVPILISRMSDFPRNKSALVESIHGIQSSAAVEEARKWLSDSDQTVRYWGALILIRYTGKAAQPEGLDELKKQLSNDKEAEDNFAGALDDLLASGYEPAMQLADSILNASFFGKSFEKDAILQRLVLAGRKAAFDYINRELDGSAADATAKFVAGWRTDSYDYKSSAPEAERKKQREELKTWLTQQQDLIKSGKNPIMNSNPRPLQRRQWHIDAP